MNPVELSALVRDAAVAVLEEHALDTSVLPATVTVERPRNPDHGDYATNVALQVAKRAGVHPRELAGWLAQALADNDAIASAEIAGPGFLNIRLAAAAQGAIVSQILAAGDSYGDNDAYAGKRICLLYTSPSPRDA